MQRGRQMTALRGWCTSPSVPANPPFQSQQAQLESGVRGNVPAPFEAGERLQSPTYRYPTSTVSAVIKDAVMSMYGGVWVMDCRLWQAYNVSMVMASCKR